MIPEYFIPNKLQKLPTMISKHRTAKPSTNELLVASGMALLVIIASLSDPVAAHRRIESCNHHYRKMYPRHYDYHRSDCAFRRQKSLYNSAMNALDELVLATTNSLSRQRSRSRQNTAFSKQRQLRYSVEDFGTKGLELVIDLPGSNARDLAVEILQKDGTDVITVRGNRASHQNKLVTNLGFSQSFEVNSDDIDIDSITAHFSAGVLRIMMPKIEREETKKPIAIISTNEYDDIVPIFVAKRDNRNDPSERKGNRQVVIEKNLEKSGDLKNSEKENYFTRGDNDLFISEEEDVW